MATYMPKRYLSNYLELMVGDNITSYDQLKEGMIVDFTTSRTDVNNAVIVLDEDIWYALHDNYMAVGNSPDKKIQTRYNKEYGWGLGFISDDDKYPFGEDYSDMVFRGWYTDPDVKPVEKVEEKKSEVKNKFKIGDMVKHNPSERKAEVIGIYEDLVWLKFFGGSDIYEDVISPSLSPWVEPLKYKKGDLVLINGIGMNVLEVFEVMANGYRLKDLTKEKACDYIYNDMDILRKVGVATPS